MSFERQVAFWVAALAVFVAVLWLLSDVLLPFVAGMALAYLLDPVARRAERLGIGRGISALIMVTLVIVVLVVAVMAGRARSSASSSSPSSTTCRAIWPSCNRSCPIRAGRGSPRFSAAQLPDAGKSVGALVTQGSGFIGAFWPRSGPAAGRCSRCCRCWSSRRSSRSICCSTGKRVVATVDGWIPLQHRETVHGLARDIDARDRRLRARAGGDLPDPGGVLCDRLDADRAQLRLPDRPDDRAAQLHSLRRRRHRISGRGDRRDRAVLAGLDVDR